MRGLSKAILVVAVLWAPMAAGGAGIPAQQGAATGAQTEFTPLDSIPEGRRPVVKSWIEGGKTKIGLGQTVELKVTIEKGAKDQVHLPADTSFGGLELVDRTVRTRPAQGGRMVEEYVLELIALEPGSVEIPGFRFRGVLASGELVALEVPARRIDVTDPTAGAKDDKPKDIAPPVDVYEDDYTLLWVLGILTGLALLVWFVRFLVINWAKWYPKAARAALQPRAPEVIALEKLNALAAGGLPASGAKKTWYVELSEIMREYIGGRWGFDGLESTTEEIVKILRGRKTQGLTQVEMFSFLNDCDMVKFAKHEPVAADDQAALSEAFRIVQVTTPTRPAGPRPGRSYDGDVVGSEK